MPTLPPNNTPQDMRDLLIRLDEKVANGFASLNAKFDALERRQDGHESRIHNIEIELADRERLKQQFFDTVDKVDEHADHLLRIETTASNVKTMVIAAWAVFGSAVLAAAAKIIGLF